LSVIIRFGLIRHIRIVRSPAGAGDFQVLEALPFGVLCDVLYPRPLQHLAFRPGAPACRRLQSGKAGLHSTVALGRAGIAESWNLSRVTFSLYSSAKARVSCLSRFASLSVQYSAPVERRSCAAQSFRCRHGFLSSDRVVCWGLRSRVAHPKRAELHGGEQ